MLFEIVVPVLFATLILVAWRTHKRQLAAWRRSIQRPRKHNM